MWSKFSYFLLVLIAIAIPIEHKYDKPFRFFSKTLIPDGLELPLWYDRKIFFYPSDLFSILLILIALFALRKPIGELLLQKGTYFLWLMIGCIAFSIYCSPLSNYPIPYIRLWQFGTALFLYALFSSINRNQVEIIFKGLIGMATFQSMVAIAQYFKQSPLGLRIISEIQFDPKTTESYLWIPEKARWIFDQVIDPNSPAEKVCRVMGTLPHPNVLGGYLCMTSLITLFFFSKKNKLFWGTALFIQLFALIITFSRGGLFGFGLGVIVWASLTYYSEKKFPFRSISLYLLAAFSLFGALFQDQIFYRGGITSVSSMSQGSDDFRTSYQKIAFRMIEQYPLQGVGYGQFPLHVKEFSKPGEDPFAYVTATATHNVYLLLASESGLLSLFCYLSFLFLLLRKASRSLQEPLVPILTSILIAFLFIGGCDFYLILFQQGRLMFFLIAGLLASQVIWKRPQESALSFS